MANIDRNLEILANLNRVRKLINQEKLRGAEGINAIIQEMGLKIVST